MLLLLLPMMMMAVMMVMLMMMLTIMIMGQWIMLTMSREVAVAETKWMLMQMLLFMTPQQFSLMHRVIFMLQP